MVTIDKLPDDILLEIFDFTVEEEFVKYEAINQELDDWRTLVHVCRRWRSVVFGSPRRLNLRLLCSDTTPARDTLDVWPPLPLSIWCEGYHHKNGVVEYMDNILAALERSDRVCYIDLSGFKSSHLEKISVAMQVPFPELINLMLWPTGETAPVLPDSLLGGDAQRLETLSLTDIPFPGLPKLLLTATHLTYLELVDIPHSGYFSPEAIVTALSTLTHLQSLRLMFKSPLSRPDPAHRRPLPLTRSVLPALTSLWFKGVSEYFEDVLACIDAPRLYLFDITFFNDIVFDIPQLVQFINRAPNLNLKALKKARVVFSSHLARVDLSEKRKGVYLKILCSEPGWQVSSMVQFCTSCLSSFSALEGLWINDHELYSRPKSQANIENALWLELLHPFTAVRNLHLSVEITRCIVPALQELVPGRVTDVLPTLQNIFLEEHQPSGPVQEGIQRFITMRQVAGHPIAITYGQKIPYW